MAAIIMELADRGGNGCQHVVKNQFAIANLAGAEKPAPLALWIVAEPENNHPAIHQYLDDITLAIMAPVEPGRGNARFQQKWWWHCLAGYLQ